MKHPNRRFVAFTLVEVIVVIVVMSALTILGFTVGQGAVSRSNNAKCASNLRNIGLGLMSYANENGGQLPPSAMLPSSAPYHFQRLTYWFDALNPYMGHPEYSAKRMEPFPAPTDVAVELPLKWQLCPGKKVKVQQRQSVGYGWNAVHFGWDFSRPGTGLGRNLYRIPEPARTILVGDSKDAGVREENQYEHRYILDYSKEKNIPFPERHAGGGNYLFADGHVTNYPPSVMKSIEGIRLLRYTK